MSGDTGRIYINLILTTDVVWLQELLEYDKQGGKAQGLIPTCLWLDIENVRTVPPSVSHTMCSFRTMPLSHPELNSEGARVARLLEHLTLLALVVTLGW